VLISYAMEHNFRAHGSLEQSVTLIKMENDIKRVDYCKPAIGSS